MTLRVTILAFAGLVSAMWPIPSSYSAGSNTLWIEPNVPVSYSRPDHYFTYALNSSSNNSPSGPLSSRIVQTAIQRTYDSLFKTNFVPWRFHPRNTDFEPSPSDKTFVKSIELTQTKPDVAGAFKALDGTVDESYTLDVSNDGKVVAKAPSSVGIAHALTSFSQFFYAHSGGSVYTTEAPIRIADSPKFPHRGLNLDVARNFYPVSAIRRMIDALAFNKFNRLHLHIIDSQSWPLEISSMPGLAGKGAYHGGATYSPEQLKDLQEYGQVLGVEVFIEIDMPGHAASVWFSQPDLIAAFNERNWQKYAAEPPSGTMKLNSSAVYSFLDALWKDILPRVSPYTSYFHLGGDEVQYEAYTLDETVRSNSAAVIQPLLQKFYDHNQAAVRAAGLTPVVWEEMLLMYGVSLPKDVLVQCWMSDSSVASTVQQGHKAIAGNYQYWYLDCGQGQFVDFEPGAASRAGWPYADYCSPRKNWRLMYSYDPLSGVPAGLEHLVVGGEVHMWSEQTDAVSVDRQVWPRAAAAGEILWSGAKDAQGQNRSQILASPRLAKMRERLVARGVLAEPVVMPFCTQNGTQCVIFNEYA